MEGLPIVLPDRGQDNLEAVASITAIMIMLNRPYITQLFHNTNDRIYRAFAGIDSIINEAANPCNSLSPYLDHNSQKMSATWASAYKAWITGKIILQNAFVASTVAIYSSQVPTMIAPNVPMNDHGRIPGFSTWMSNWNHNHGLHALTFPSISTWPEGSLNIQKRQGINTMVLCTAIVSSAPPSAIVSTSENYPQTRGFVTIPPTAGQTSVGSMAAQPAPNISNVLSLPPRYSRVNPTTPIDSFQSKETPTASATVKSTTNIRNHLSLPPKYSR